MDSLKVYNIRVHYTVLQPEASPTRRRTAGGLFNIAVPDEFGVVEAAAALRARLNEQAIAGDTDDGFVAGSSIERFAVLEASNVLDANGAPVRVDYVAGPA